MRSLSIRRRTIVLATIIAALIYAFVLYIGAHCQTIDGDEGAYLNVFRELYSGGSIRIYQPQLPVWLYVFVGVVRILNMSISIDNLRIVTIAFSFTTVILTYWIVRRVAQSMLIALLSACLLAFNLCFFVNQVHFKHYSVSNASLVACLLLLCISSDLFTSGRRKAAATGWFVAGVLAGVAANSRSVFFAFLVINLLWILWAARGSAMRAILLHLAGFVACSCFTLKLYTGTLHQAYLRAFGWYSVYVKPTGQTGGSKLYSLLANHSPLHPISFQAGIITALYLISIYILLNDLAHRRVVPQMRQACLLAGYGALMCFLYTVLAYEISFRYWNQVIVMQVIAGAYALARFSGRLKPSTQEGSGPLYAAWIERGASRLESVFTSTMGRWCSGAVFAVYLLCFFGAGVTRDQYPSLGVFQSPIAYMIYGHRYYPTYRSIGTTMMAATALSQLTSRDATVLSWFNSILIESNRHPLKGFEAGCNISDVFWTAAHPISESDAATLGVLSVSQVSQAIKERIPEAIVTDPYTSPDLKLLVEQNYIFRRSVAEYRIFTRSAISPGQ